MATATYTNIDGDLDNATAWDGGGGTSGRPTNGDDVVVDRNGRDITTNLATFAAIEAKSMLIKGVGVIRGTNGEALQMDVDGTGGTKTLTVEGRGEVHFDGDTAMIKNRSESTLRIVGGAHVAWEATRQGGIIFGSSATVTGAGNVAGRFSNFAIFEASGTATGQITVSSPGGTVTMKSRNASRIDALSDGAVMRFEGTAKLTSTGSVLGPKAIMQLAGTAANFDDLIFYGTIDATELKANTQIDDTTIIEGAKIIGSPAGYTIAINGEGTSNDSDIVGAPDLTSIFA